MPQEQSNQQSQQENQSPPTENESLFIVSSAIHANHGVYSTEERMNQTIETCKSIRQRVENCDIIVLDGGTQQLTDEEKALIDPHIKMFYSYADADNIKEVQKSKNWDVVKNMSEIIIFGSFFQEHIDFIGNGYDRVFKISGRYVLNDDFDYQFHMNQKKSIVIRGLYTSQFPASVTGNVNLQFMSRLWSFDSSFIRYISFTYRDMFEHMNRRLNAGGYIDIEHLLYAHLDPNVTKIVNKIGIEGNIAPNGVKVSD